MRRTFSLGSDLKGLLEGKVEGLEEKVRDAQSIAVPRSSIRKAKNTITTTVGFTYNGQHYVIPSSEYRHACLGRNKELSFLDGIYRYLVAHGVIKNEKSERAQLKESADSPKPH